MTACRLTEDVDADDPSHWHESPDSTEDRWDPSNGATERFPAILLAGPALDSGLTELRRRLAVPA